MDRLFRQIGETELHGSQATLNFLQARLREEQSSGLIEALVNAGRQIVLVFANGAQVGAYLREDGLTRPFHLDELSALWGGAPFPLRLVPLPDKAGRAAWLALESRRQAPLEVRGGEAWVEALKRWNAEKFDGVVEVASEACQGFALIRNGGLIASESAVFDGERFSSSLAEKIGGGWKATPYTPNPLTKSCQALILRLGAVRWVNGLLERFQGIAGTKFLQVVDKEIRMLIQPWKWRILLNDAAISDEHFFAGPEAAAQAYRTIFMGLGAHAGFVIGNTLTQRILAEAFEELEQAERAALESKRLVPAAFSD